MFKRVCVIAALLSAGAALAAVEINKATEADLDGLNGIGPATTQSILKERKKGEFKDWADLMQRVKGIGEARAAKLSAGGLTVGGTSYKDKSPIGGQPKSSQKPAENGAATLTPAAVQPADKKQPVTRQVPQENATKP